MRGKELLKALRTSSYVFGTCLEGYGQPRWPRFFAQIGLDFVFIDTEHTPLNKETVAWAAQAYSAWNIAPLVRIPKVSASYAAMALDLGAHGVVAPYVETISQVKKMIGAVKYRPLKGSTLQKALDEGIFPNEATETYLAEYNQDAVLWIMIESPAGVARLNEMLSLGQVDGVLIGPHDLSVSYGYPEAYESPQFIEIVDHIVQICQEHQVSVGMHVSFGDIKYEGEWLQKGCNIVMHSSDKICFASNLAKELHSLREIVGYADEAYVEVDGKRGHAI